MTTFYDRDGITVHHGDGLDVLAELPDASVDAVVTDPPYGLEFMGKDWDAPWKQGSDVHADARHRRAEEMSDENKRRYIAASVNKFQAGKPFQDWCQLWTAECLRILKPGGHLLAFGGTRTWHRLAVAVEDAGFEIRDSIAWMYGSGFPKSLDVSKAIDKAAGAEREDVYADAEKVTDNAVYGKGLGVGLVERRPVTDAARTWQGWGTALKPAFEPVVVARKPLAGTVAANVLAHGTGALNIDGCRIVGEPWKAHTATGLGSVKFFTEGDTPEIEKRPHDGGRWPANVILDESQAAALDEVSGTLTSGKMPAGTQKNGKASGIYGEWKPEPTVNSTPGDSGGASRFFFIAQEDDNLCPSTNDVSTATSHSSAPSDHDGSARSGAATSASLDTNPPTRAASTSAKATESRPSAESDTPLIPSTGGKSSPESLPAKHIQTPSPARNAATSEPTDTTTTTTNPPRSDGSAANATSSTTSGSKVPGDRDLPIDVLDSRFTYTAKADAAERPKVNGTAHPTVKPLSLMQWVVRLVTPPGGVVLEPFAGSGTTIEACIIEGFRCVAIEREADYLPLIEARITRRRDPARAVELSGEDMGLLGLLGEEPA